MIPNGPPLLTWGLCATAIRTEYKSASPCAQLPDRKPGIENWSWTATNWGTEFGKSIQLNSQIRKQQMETFFQKKKHHGKKQCILRRRMKRKRRGYCIFFPSVCYCGAALMESILRARERCIKCCGGGLARPLIAGIRNATRNVVISKIVSPFFIVYWRPFLPLQPKNGREINGNSLETFILIKVFASTIPGLESLMMVAVNTINADTTLWLP